MPAQDPFFPPIFPPFPPAPQGLRYSPTVPSRGVGSQQEVDFDIDQKENLGCQWKEGVSIAQKTSGEWGVDGVPRAATASLPPPLLPVKRGAAQNRVAGSSKMKLLLLATRGKAEVWKLSYPALGTGGGSLTACGDNGQQDPSGLTLLGFGGGLLQHPATPHPNPQGPATCSSFLRPCILGSTGEPAVRPPHPCEKPRCQFPNALQPSLPAGIMACAPQPGPHYLRGHKRAAPDG